MNSIPKVSLEDTLSLIQLMREAALVKGREAQANQLAPLADQMRKIVVTAHESQPATAPSNGLMGQSDFQTLLNLSKNQNGALPVQTSAASMMERNGLNSRDGGGEYVGCGYCAPVWHDA